MSDDDVSIGEVGRNVEHLRKSVDAIGKDVTELKVGAGISTSKIDRLERIVYGALGAALTALLTAIIAVVMTAGNGPTG